MLTAISANQIPVYPGAADGLTRPAVHAPAIHGESGLAGTDLLPIPAVKHVENESYITAMAKALLSTPKNTAWLVATGAMTNVAHLLNAHPEVAAHIKGLSMMGGAIGNHTEAPMGKVDDRERIGNWSVWAEFNVLVDPEAAQQLFQNEILNKKIALLPLDVTHLVLATKDVQEILLNGKDGRSNTTLRTMLVELLMFFANTYSTVFGITEGPPLHDPLAIAIVLNGIAGAEIPFYDFKTGQEGRRERYFVDVVTEGSHEEALSGSQTGRTIAKLLPEGKEGVLIPRGLDIQHFWTVLEDSLEAADKANVSKGLSGDRF